jgi:XTP/dITP diphosphohydrolase
MQVVLATKNKGKVKEFNKYLQEIGWEVISLDQFPDIPAIIEDGNSFSENAVKKATTVMRATGLTAIADDSGIVVDALAGRPGIYSARFAGENATDKDNNLKLLTELHGVPDEARTAKFVASIAIVSPDNNEPIVFDGECFGKIVSTPAGDSGFGYDPLFYIESEGKTMAELSLERKNQISHRAKALLSMKKFFQKV